MKTLTTFILCCFISIGCMAQKSDTLITYNFNSIPTKKVKKATSLYKVFKKDSTTWIRITSDNNFIVTKKESFSDSTLIVLNGNYVEYRYGKPYLKGVFIKNMQQGVWLTYDSTGKARSSKVYLDGKLNGPFTSYWPNTSICQQANYINSMPVGERTFFYDDGKLAIKEVYDENSNLIDSIYLDINGKPTSFDKLYKEPGFPGGLNKLYSFVGRGLKYPEVALRDSVQGKVFISFVVNEEGYLEDITVISSPHPSLSKETIRLFKTSPRWIPATFLNKPVAEKYNLNTNFALQDAKH